MARTRRRPSVSSAAEDDSLILAQRSRKGKAALTGPQNSDPSPQGHVTEERKRPLYHCNYCNKDISEKKRIKCAMCPDFDLCVECYSVGAEVSPHKSNHPYRVMGGMTFQLLSPDWNADEEILLLEGIEMYGASNWAEVAEHVGTKSDEQCVKHYTDAYLNSPCFPLPDMSHLEGKSREELLATAEGQGRKGFLTRGEFPVNKEPTFPPSGIKIKKSGLGQSPSSITADVDTGYGFVKKASDGVHIKDDQKTIKLEEESRADGSIELKKPKPLNEGGPSMAKLSGYNPKRNEFDPEYNADAEKLIADLEFKDTDTEADHQLKLKMLHIYNRCLDERERRKKFVLERDLLYPDSLVKDLSPEARVLYDRYRVFMGYHSKEDHETMMKTVIETDEIRRELKILQEARDAGCHTYADLERYNEMKKDAEKIGRGAKHMKGETSSTIAANSLEEWDVVGLPGSDLLSTTERRLCNETRMLPAQYLDMQQVISMKILDGSITKKSDAHSFFRVDPSKVDRVYDMLAKKGISPP